MVSQLASISLANHPTIQFADAASGATLVVSRAPRAVLVLFHFTDRIRGWLQMEFLFAGGRFLLVVVVLVVVVIMVVLYAFPTARRCWICRCRCRGSGVVAVRGIVR